MRYLVTMPEGEERDSFLTPPVREKLNAMGEVIWNTTGRHLREAEVIEMGRGAAAVITCWGSPMLTAEAVRQMPALKLVIHLAGTVQPYVSEAVYRMGVRVISGNRFFAESVAEGALTYILCALRDIPYYSGKLMKEMQWLPPAGNRGILDRTVGLVSFGAIAQNLAHMLQPFRVRIKVYSRGVREETLKQYRIQRADLAEIFSTCDIISLHTAYNEHTRHMVDAELLSKIKEGALFVNTARGGLVDEEALVRELRTGRFRAVLDVFETEPLPAESGLLNLENVLLMPHMCGPTVDRRAYIAAALLEEARAYLEDGAGLPDEITLERALCMSDK